MDWGSPGKTSGTEFGSPQVFASMPAAVRLCRASLQKARRLSHSGIARIQGGSGKSKCPRDILPRKVEIVRCRGDVLSVDDDQSMGGDSDQGE